MENTTNQEVKSEELVNETNISEEYCDSIVEETIELTELEKLAKEVAELKDNNLRLVAEMQNNQRRSQDEVKKARDFAISNFAKEIITVKDYLEMALKDQSGNFDMLKMGVDLTLQQVVKVFDSQQIKEINPQSKDKLDANLHQAMSVVEEHEQEPNTIVSVMQKGYMLNGRVLRPAMVTVSK